ncbi:hypothetical protein [Flammeovirga pacifica]|uniref:Uncharacterized protein n=1 Tax=Flammeovirga pacifica TaxID=915059 RepID=A0A1S1YU97_FLAPC|nr:hypothetical protein [Flammeovirga pacifica]OHX64607.1 hypothetical protein NH26_23845 [Flammeovirga pacifica]
MKNQISTTAIYCVFVMIMISFFASLSSCSNEQNEDPEPQPDPITSGYKFTHVIVDMKSSEEEIDPVKDEVSFYICKDVDTYEKQKVIITDVGILSQLKEEGEVLVKLDEAIVIPADQPFYCFGEYLGAGEGVLSPIGDFKIDIPEDLVKEIPKDKIVDAPGPIGVTGFNRHK